MTLAESFQAANTHLMVWNPALPQPLYSSTYGMNERMEADYQAHYGEIDPRRLRAAELPEGGWFACHQHFDAREVDRNEFYQDYLIPGACRWLLGARLTRCNGLDVYFGMHRAPDQEPFSDHDISIAQSLTPHFQAASQLWLATRSLRQQAVLGIQALDTLEYGVIIADAQGRVLHANRRAEAFLQSGWPLRTRLGKIQSASAEGSTTTLHAALGNCTRTRRPQWLRYGQTGDPARPLCMVTMLYLAGDEVTGAPHANGSILLLLNHATHRRHVTVEQLILLFDLSPAEGRLAHAIAAGKTVEV